MKFIQRITQPSFGFLVLLFLESLNFWDLMPAGYSLSFVWFIFIFCMMIFRTVKLNLAYKKNALILIAPKEISNPTIFLVPALILFVIMEFFLFHQPLILIVNIFVVWLWIPYLFPVDRAAGFIFNDKLYLKKMRNKPIDVKRWDLIKYRDDGACFLRNETEALEINVTQKQARAIAKALNYDWIFEKGEDNGQL